MAVLAGLGWVHLAGSSELSSAEAAKVVTRLKDVSAQRISTSKSIWILVEAKEVDMV